MLCTRWAYFIPRGPLTAVVNQMQATLASDAFNQTDLMTLAVISTTHNAEIQRQGRLPVTFPVADL